MVQGTSANWVGAALTRLPHAIIALFAAVLYLMGYTSLVDDKLTDLGFRSSTRPATGNVILVAIDAKSIDALQVWPWPRRLHAQLLDRLMDAGASRVAFDVDFSAHSRTEEDAALAAALGRAAGRVILPAFRQISLLADGRTELKQTVPLPEFRHHVVLSSVNVQPDPDGLVRRMASSDGGLPSMAALLAGAENTAPGVFHIDFGIRPSTVPQLSYVDVLRGNFDPALIAGRQAVIGSTAIELGDQVAVPVYQSIPGPLAHILGYESLVQDRALRRVAPGPVVVGVLLLTLLLGPMFLTWSWRKSLLVYLALSGGLVAMSVGVQVVFPVLIDVAPLLIAALLSFFYAVIKRTDQQALRLVFQSIDLRRKDVMMRSVVQNSSDGIITMDESSVVEAANPSARKIFGDDIVGRRIGTFLPSLQDVHDQDALVAALRVGMGLHELEGRHADGRTIPVELSVTVVDTDDHCVFTIFLRDITDRKLQERKLVYQATHDALTGLPNRRLFFSDRLHGAIEACTASGGQFTVLLLDLDRFKEVNDTLGHPTGDELLKKISERLRSAVAEEDTIARIGGDEFAMLLPSTDNVDDACRTAARILNILNEPFDLAGLTLEIGGSIGITMFPEHGDEAATLVKCADVAMYLAKQGQSGYAVYDAEKDHNSVRFLTLTGDMRRAIENDQLALYYQPKICLKRNRIIAVEALIRWIHPEHGFIPPDEFIDKAEQTGVIGDMTAWVLDTALAQAAAWRRRGVEIDMAVNVSARLLTGSEIEDMVRDGLRKWQVPPASLILEVTENALMDDPAEAMAVVTRLSELGARISIDDFGTGYSSLGYLKDLPANEMKIDKCFVQALHEDEGNETIVRSTVGLAHALGLKVVAEGIETDDVRAHLAGIECDVGQGYLFSKPLPIGEFDDWLETSPWGLHETAGDGVRETTLGAV